MTKKSIFDYLNALFYKKNIEYNKKEASGYILTLWLSHDKTLIDLTNKVNEYLFKIDDDLLWKIYFEKIPKGKRYIKWIKADKKESGIEKELKEQYKLSSKEAKLLSLIVEE